MIKTYNRRPMSVATPSSSDVKEYYFNHYNFKGISDNKNILSVDQESFEDCLNVYVDEQGMLKSRPSIKATGDLSNIYDVWVLGQYVVYITDDKKLYLFSDNEQLVEPIELNDIDCKLNLIQDNILIFSKTSLQIIKLDTFTLHDATSIVLIPELSGDKYRTYDENELTTVVKKVYQYNNLIETVEFIGDTIHFTLYGVNYALTVEKLYDLDRLVKVYLDLKHVDKSDFEMWSTNRSSEDALFYRYGTNLRMYFQGITTTIPYPDLPDKAEGSNVVFSLAKNSLTFVAVYGYKHASESGRFWYAIKTLTYSFVDNLWTTLDTTYPAAAELNAHLLILKVFMYDNNHLAISYQTDYDRINKTQSLYVSSSGRTVTTGGYSHLDYHDVIFSGDVIYALLTRYGTSYIPDAEVITRVLKPGEAWTTIYSKSLDVDAITNGKLFYQDNKLYRYLLIKCNDVIYHYLYENDDEKIAGVTCHSDRYVIEDSKIIASYNNTLNIIACCYLTDTAGKRFAGPQSTRFVQYDTSSSSVVRSEYIQYASLNDNLIVAASKRYFYYVDVNENVISNNIDETLDVWTISEGGFVNVYPDKVIQDDDKLYLIKGNKLYINEPYVNLEGNFQLYFPKRNTETFDEDITNVHKISNDELAIFFENNVMIAKRGTVELDGTTYNGYYYSKSKLPIGCKKYSDIITSFDGAYTIIPTKRGLAYLNYQQFVASTDQIVTYISDNVNSIWYEFGKEPVKLYKDSYYIYCYKETSTECFVLDVRTNGWFRWLLPKNVSDIATINDEPQLLLDGQLFTFDYSDENYYDYVHDEKSNIDWYVRSQKLYLNAFNYYKHLNNITLTSVLDSDRPLTFELQLINYRDKVDVSRTETVEYDVDTVRTFVQKLNYSKVIEFQYYLQNSNDYAIQVPLSLSNITIKYKIGGQVR